MSSAFFQTGGFLAFALAMGTLVAAVWLGILGHGQGYLIPIAYFASTFGVKLLNR